MINLSALGPADFLRAVLDTPPPGPAFSGDPDTVQAQVFTPPANALANVHAASMRLLEIEADPAYTIQLLPEWENDYGLPDPCTPLNPTLDQRRLALLSKIAAIGGQSIAYFVGFAAALGYTITITEFQPFRLGVSHFGDLLCGPLWEYVWQVNAPSITVSRFRFGPGAFGEPFWTIDNTELECRLRAIMPAHTRLNFSYS